MSSKSVSCVVAASMAAVEAMKDQGICRWNYPIRSACQSGKSRGSGSGPQAKSFSSQSISSMGSSSKVREDERVRQSEDSLRKVMYLSCWGPN
ncbi:hypothetical protein SAY87_030127 [Trapa incisa]|uniref:Wound-responsive family protein n=2 Tax=Trapa TaxID=22665 RepID=A0AAN7KSJ7_TRANT|nr:hypothetical protein SAY87_030127 [Trapa incisa]KAK4768756.1 hypothetical protein SAY86_026906 [Trapa natans]